MYSYAVIHAYEISGSQSCDDLLNTFWVTAQMTNADSGDVRALTRVRLFCACTPALSPRRIPTMARMQRQGVIETTRGRGGGLRLLQSPADIRIGDVVRASETDFRMVECFDARTNQCTLTPTCRLKHVLDAALKAYFRELDGATLADIAGPGAGKPRTTAASRGNMISPPASRRRVAVPVKGDRRVA